MKISNFKNIRQLFNLNQQNDFKHQHGTLIHLRNSLLQEDGYNFNRSLLMKFDNNIDQPLGIEIYGTPEDIKELINKKFTYEYIPLSYGKQTQTIYYAKEYNETINKMFQKSSSFETFSNEQLLNYNQLVKDHDNFRKFTINHREYFIVFGFIYCESKLYSFIFEKDVNSHFYNFYIIKQPSFYDYFKGLGILNDLISIKNSFSNNKKQRKIDNESYCHFIFDKLSLMKKEFLTNFNSFKNPIIFSYKEDIKNNDFAKTKDNIQNINNFEQSFKDFLQKQVDKNLITSSLGFNLSKDFYKIIDNEKRNLEKKLEVSNEMIILDKDIALKYQKFF